MKSIGGSLAPENYRELRARFAVIVGREPTEAEMSELMTDKDELGIGYGDPLLLQMMMFKRERIALAELFERQLALIGKELREAQDFVLRETDKELTRRQEQIAGSRWRRDSCGVTPLWNEGLLKLSAC